MTATEAVSQELLSKRQTAALLGLGVRSVERLAARGVLTAVKPAGMRVIRFRRVDVLKWIAGGCQENAPRKR